MFNLQSTNIEPELGNQMAELPSSARLRNGSACLVGFCWFLQNGQTTNLSDNSLLFTSNTNNQTHRRYTRRGFFPYNDRERCEVVRSLPYRGY